MVVDASAVLALINREAGWETVAKALPAALISAVNLAEVAGKLIDHGLPATDVDSLLAGLGLAVIPFDDEMALATGKLRSLKGGTRLSLGDRACLQLARHRSLPALTADRYWARIDTGVELSVIR